jgi:tRNA1Val (adenine37-N6)-methyltransferase
MIVSYRPFDLLMRIAGFIMPDFCTLWPGGPLFRQSAHFPLCTDSVLLADFVNTASLRRGIDLGCGSGAISLLLLFRDTRVAMTGVDVLPEAAEIARENMQENGLCERSSIITGDVRACRKLFQPGSFDFAVSNPPYFASGSGLVPSDTSRAAARTEAGCALADMCAGAASLVRTGGAFFVVYRPERLSELFCAMSGRGIEPKRLRLVQHSATAAPSLVLVEGRRGGRTGLKIESPLYLTDGGADSAEVRRIYHLDTEETK